MHRALFVSEIVERICFVLGSEVIHDYVSVPIPVLAVLARTCRAFNESAVDLIWAKASPWHLALRMDAEICTIEEQRLGADGAHTKTRLSLLVDIEEAIQRGLGARFEFYAKRLRTHKIDRSYRPAPKAEMSIDADVLICWARMSHLCPRVRKVDLSIDSLHPQLGPTTLGGFLAPGRLSSLVVTMTQSAIHPDIIAALHGACTTTKTLTMSMGGPYVANGSYSPQISTMLSGATKLQAVTSYASLDYIHLTYLTANPGLKHLELHCSKEDRTTDAMPLPTDAFALHNLVVNDHSSAAWMTRSILGACASPSLVLCRAYITSSIGVHDLRQIFECLGSHTNLCHLTLEGPETFYNELTFVEVLPFLKGLRNLKVLVLPCCVVPSFSMAMLIDLVDSCPQLESWSLFSRRVSPTQSFCTLSLTTFLGFVKAHPLIQRLPVTVSMQGPVSPEQRIAFLSSYKNDLLVVDIEDMDDTKQLMHELFPEMWSLSVWEETAWGSTRMGSHMLRTYG